MVNEELEQLRKDCKISKDTKNLMFSLIDKAEKKQREHFMKLCKDKNGNIIHSDFCVGKEVKFSKDGSGKIIHSVSSKKIEKICECPKDTEEIGSFHTHPYGDFRPSGSDIVRAALDKDSLTCIGSRSYEWKEELQKLGYLEKVSCYDIADKVLLRLGDDAQELAKEGKIDKVKKDILPLAFDRVKKVTAFKMPRGILKLKCKMEREGFSESIA